MKRIPQLLEVDDISLTLKQLNFKVLHFGIFVCRKAAMLKPTFLHHYRLCIVNSGSFRLGKDSFGYELKLGDLLIMSPHTLYQASAHEENSSFYYLDFIFDEAKNSQSFSELLQFNDFRFFKQLINQRQLTNLEHLNQTVKINYPGTYMLVECMLMRILIVMLKQLKESNQAYIISTPNNAKERLILQCVQYIEDHHKEPFTIQEMANELQYTENYIYKLFKESFGISCKTFIQDFRLEKAYHELKSTHLSISEIAEIYGYSTIYQFSKAFKKKYGFSPSNLRKETV